MKKVLYVILGIIGIWLFLFLFDLGLCLSNNKPIIILKQVQFVDGDTHITEYYSLGYKVIEYSKGWIKDYEMKFINTQVMSDNFVIIDNVEECRGSKNYFYEDVNFKYYFNCSKIVKIRFKDGSELILEDALHQNKVTIKELEQKGLSFNTENKILYTFEIKKDNTCSYLEADPLKLEKVTNEISYYCLDRAKIYIDRNYYDFKDAYNNKIHLENILYDMNKETVYSSGAVMYSFANYRILVCSNKNIILGPSEMEYFDIFCE